MQFNQNPVNQNPPGCLSPYGAVRQPYHAAVPASGVVCLPVRCQDSFQSQHPQAKAQKQSSWYITLGKEVLKTGLVVGASVVGGIFGNVPGAMAAGSIMAAAVSASEQKLSKGKIDWGKVAIDFGLGLIPGGVGNRLVQGGERLLSKMAGRTISAGVLNTTQHAVVKGAADGAIMGYIGSSVLSAYDNFRKDGRIHWREANMAGIKSIPLGMLGGGFAAGGVTAVGRKLALRSAQKSNTIGSHELPPMPTDEALKQLKPPKRTWANRFMAMIFQHSEDPILANLHRVDDHVIRGAMPESEAAFDRLQTHHNVHTIIDVRGPATTKAEHIQYEMGHCKKRNIRYISIPMDSTRAPSQEELQRLMAAIQEAKAANGKVYVHCKHGIDRTGAMIAAYELATDQSQVAPAVLQQKIFQRMQQHGYNTFHEWSRPAQKEFVLSPELPNIVKTAQQGAEIRIQAQQALNLKTLSSENHAQLLTLLNTGQIEQARAILGNGHL